MLLYSVLGFDASVERRQKVWMCGASDALSRTQPCGVQLFVGVIVSLQRSQLSGTGYSVFTIYDIQAWGHDDGCVCARTTLNYYT